MNDISPLEPRPHRPFPPEMVALLREVAAAASEKGIQWFVGGASARDIVLTHVHDIEPTRATADVDIVAGIVTPDVRDQILAVIAPDDPSPLILTHMMASRTRIFGGDTAERISQLFDAFRQEFVAVVQRGSGT